MMRRHHALHACVVSLLGVAACTDPHAPAPRVMTRLEAESIVRTNNAALNLRFKTTGRWAARWMDRGRRESYKGKLYLDAQAPDSVRVRGQVLGTEAFEIGCNDRRAWVWQRYPDDQESLVVGRPERVAAAHTSFPLRPGMLIDALGLQRLDDPDRADRSVFRVTDDAHQIIYIDRAESGAATIEREVWLDRFPPYLIRRVIHRNLDGQIVADIALADHRPIEPDGPLLARKITARLPRDDAEFELRLTGAVRQYDTPGVALLDPLERQEVFPVTLPSDERIHELD